MRGIRFLLTLSGACFGVHGRASDFPAGREAPVLLPPWVIEERIDRPLQAAREDQFASVFGPSSVIASEAWSARGVATLAEALRQAPGVMLQESFGGFEPPRLSVRGSGLDSAPTSRGIALLIDGLPLARADGTFHSGLLDPQLFSRVEIYRGSLHTALTPAVLGGVLHAVSHSAHEESGTQLHLEAGEFGAVRGRLVQSAERVRIAASFARGDGGREHNAQERRAGHAVFRHALSASTRVDVSLYAADAYYEVPGPLTFAAAFIQPRLASAAVRRDRPRRDATIVRGSVQLESELDQARLTAGIAWQRLHDDFYQLVTNGETDATSDDASAHLTWSRQIVAAGWTHRVLLRGTALVGKNRVDRYLNDQARRGARFGAFDARADTAALSVEDIAWLNERIAFGAGVTILHARRRLEDRAAGSSASVARELRYRHISPRAGLTWCATRDVSLHAGVSHAVEPPAFDDLVAVAGAFPQLALRSRDLRAQRATTVEFGVAGRLGGLSWNVTGYRAAWRDEILRLADAAGQPRGAVNAGPTVHAGIESAVRWTLVEQPLRVSFAATSTLGRFTFEDDAIYGRNRIAGAPPHVGRVELTAENRRGYFAAVETTWVSGRTFVDHAARLSYGGHALLHVRAGWKATPQFTVFVAARNVRDRAHLASTAGVLDLARSPATTAIFLPGVGRNFTLGIEWKPQR